MCVTTWLVGGIFLIWRICFPLFFIILWFLATNAHVTFNMFAKHLVAIVAPLGHSSSKPFFFSPNFFTTNCNHLHQLKFFHNRQKKYFCLGFCFLDFIKLWFYRCHQQGWIQKKSSKRNVSIKVTKTTTTIGSEHIVYNKISVWPNLKY